MHEKEAKVVEKPWGREIWLNYVKGESIGEKPKRYVYKKLHIRKGTKTSFQYHEKKHETDYLVDGKAEIWLENEAGVIDKSIVEAGEVWTIDPPKKHRIIALTDITLLEVSTPEVDDVVRIADDYLRPDGRIESEHH